MAEKIEKEECVKCGEPLDVVTNVKDRIPCPKCKSMGRKRIAEFNEKITVKDSGEITHSGTRTTKSYSLLIISFVITGVGAFTGYFAVGEFGVIIGIVLGFVAWYVGKDAIEKRSFRNREKF